MDVVRSIRVYEKNKTFFGPVRFVEDWTLNVVKLINIQRLRWFGYIVRLEENILPKRAKASEKKSIEVGRNPDLLRK